MPVFDPEIAERALDVLRNDGGFSYYWDTIQKKDGSYTIAMIEISDSQLKAFLNNFHVRSGFSRFTIGENKQGKKYIEISDPDVIQALADNQLRLLRTFKAEDIPAQPIPPSQSTSSDEKLPSIKKTSDFETIKKLRSSEATGLYSHEVYIDKKTRPGAKPYPWYKKPEPDSTVAGREVLAQELFRFFITNHPKTRLVISERDDYVSSSRDETYVTSREVPGLIPLEKMDRDELRKKFISKEYTGLGEVMVMALLLDESDLKLGNMVVDAQGKVVKFDGDWCFASLRDPNRSIHISDSSVSALPMNTESTAFNWLDVKMGGLPYRPVLATAEIRDNPQFRREVNETILKVLLFDNDNLRHFISYYIADPKQVEQLLAIVIDRKEKLRMAAYNDDNFCQFMQSKGATEVMDKFIGHIDTACLTGKEGFVVTPEGMAGVHDEFKKIKDSADKQFQLRKGLDEALDLAFKQDVSPAESTPKAKH